MLIEVGIAQRACIGEQVCGDSYTVEVTDKGALVSVCDGLGHGPKAAEASQAFAECITGSSLTHVTDLMLSAHSRLSSTRGAAAALLRLDEEDGQIHFTGVGNIMLHSAESDRIHPVCAPGIVGHRLRKVLPFKFDLPRSGLLAMCSDGISSRLELEKYASLSPQDVADDILKDQGKAHDDATCVVIRYSSSG